MASHDLSPSQTRAIQHDANITHHGRRLERNPGKRSERLCQGGRSLMSDGRIRRSLLDRPDQVNHVVCSI